MKKYFIGIFMAFIVSAGFAAGAQAGVLNTSGAAGTIMPPYNNCSYTSIEAPVGNATCLIRFPIPLEPGRTITTIYFYYYDSAIHPPQYIRARVIRYNLSALANQMVFQQVDTVQKPGVPYIQATINKLIGNDEVYYADVQLDANTQIRGLKVYYY